MHKSSSTDLRCFLDIHPVPSHRILLCLPVHETSDSDASARLKNTCAVNWPAQVCSHTPDSPPLALRGPCLHQLSVTMAALKSLLMLLLAAVAAFVMAAPMAEAKGVSL